MNVIIIVHCFALCVRNLHRKQRSHQSIGTVASDRNHSILSLTDRTLAAIDIRPKFCSLPAESGLCLAALRRWFYNEKTGRCQEFTYGGCGGNENNFKSEEECVKTCKPKCPPLPCLKFIKCAYGMATDENGCTICKCNNPCEVRPLVRNMQYRNYFVLRDCLV